MSQKKHVILLCPLLISFSMAYNHEINRESSKEFLSLQFDIDFAVFDNLALN
jgi:hypothetical protein